MSLRLNGSTSGYTEIDAPAVAGSNTITLPTGAGSANQFLKNGSTAGSLGWSSLVEDSSNRLLVGTSSSPSAGQGQYAVFTAQGYIGSGGATGGAYINLQRGEAATAITAEEELGLINFGDNAGNTFGTIACRADATAGSGDYPGRLVFSTTADGASSPTERMRIRSDGRLLTFSSSNSAIVGSTATAAGSVASVFELNHSATSTTNGTTSFYVLTNGDVRNTNNSYGAISDIKLKENIVDASSQWDDLKALQVRNYNFKPETNQETHTQIGLVAQEVELVSPGLVGESPDRDEEGNDLGTVTKSVNYSVLYMKAVKALQEAMERIEALESNNASLEARLTALEVTP